MHLADHLMGMFIPYFTSVLVFPLLDARHLETSLDVVRLFFPLRITLDVVQCDKPVSFIPAPTKLPSLQTPVLITLLQHKLTIFVIHANHACADGTLIYNLLHVWSKAYRGSYTIPKLASKINFVGNYPLSQTLVSRFKVTHPFSDYIISTTIWSHFISLKTNIRTFGHTVSFRDVDDAYTQGNFIRIVSVELGETIRASCELLKNAIQSERGNVNKTTAAFSAIKSYVKCQVIYTSWLKYKFLNFGTSCNGFYSTGFEKRKMIASNRINVVCMHDTSYYLSHSIDGCDNASFREYVKQIRRKERMDSPTP